MANSGLISKRYFHLDETQKLNWLRLMRSQNVGPVIFRDLISHYGSAASALEALPDLAKQNFIAVTVRTIAKRTIASVKFSAVRAVEVAFSLITGTRGSHAIGTWGSGVFFSYYKNRTLVNVLRCRLFSVHPRQWELRIQIHCSCHSHRTAHPAKHCPCGKTL